jgi:hypothetical protein
MTLSILKNQQNDTQLNKTQHNDTQQNNTQYNYTQHKEVHHNWLNCNPQLNDSQPKHQVGVEYQNAGVS